MRAAVDASSGHVEGVEVRSHDHIFVGMLRALHRGDDVVIGHGSDLEVVADVELQLHAATLLDHLAYAAVLILVEQNVGRGGQAVERNALPHHFDVVQRCDGHRGRTNEAQRAGLDHLVV